MMTSGKLTTIARPYVSAAFEYALANKDVPAWEAMLEAAAIVSQDPYVAEHLSSPHVTKAQLVEFFCGILKPLLDANKTNFIHLLADNNRLGVLPDIAELFKVSHAAQEKKLNVEVISATELTEAYQQKLAIALSKRLQRQVEMQCEIDPTLLGGVIVRAGDLVIDGSVRGKLTRLRESL